MIRRLIRTVLGLIAVAMVFTAGAGTATLRGWGARSVTIDVVNASSRPIRSVEIQVDTCSRRTLILEPSPPESGLLTYSVSVCGEGGYRLTVVFADGTSLSTREGYIESGYRVTETVRGSTIESTTQAFRY